MKAPRRETYPNRTVKLLGYCFSWESRLVQVDEPRTGQHPKYRRDECQNDEQEESHEEQVRVVAEKPAPLSSPMRWGMHDRHYSASIFPTLASRPSRAFISRRLPCLSTSHIVGMLLIPYCWPN